LKNRTNRERKDKKGVYLICVCVCLLFGTSFLHRSKKKKAYEVNAK